eukprot:TRINITY_DN42902_c0_g1_i1.p2 TRINITY_DN42902_c0_g1~~TRINITY_DN42902_c0_g1_i1.p2  ORF type:complete len:413 (+),score=143.46 TRINITY_DN42902_c0_g1_i1:60-1241(+)
MSPAPPTRRPHYLKYGHSGGPRFAQCGDQQLYYEVHGSGPVKVLLVPPLAATHTVWEPQYAYFGSRPEFTVCAYDGRGIGFSAVKSPQPAGRWTTTLLARDALQLLQHLEKGDGPGEGKGWQRVHVVGLSMGGMVSQELALMAPERVSSLTLISTFAGGLSACPPVTGVTDLFRLIGDIRTANRKRGEKAPDDAPLRVGVGLMFPLQWRKESGAKLVGPPPAGDSNEERAVTLLRGRSKMYKEAGAQESNMRTIARQLGAICCHYVSRRRLRRLKAAGFPILIVSGQQDVLVRPHNSRWMAEWLDAEHLHFRNAGHGVNEQHSDVCNTAVADMALRADAAKPSTEASCPPHHHPWGLLAAALLVVALAWTGVLPAVAAAVAAVCAAAVLVTLT